MPQVQISAARRPSRYRSMTSCSSSTSRRSTSTWQPLNEAKRQLRKNRRSQVTRGSTIPIAWSLWINMSEKLTLRTMSHLMAHSSPRWRATLAKIRSWRRIIHSPIMLTRAPWSATSPPRTTIDSRCRTDSTRVSVRTRRELPRRRYHSKKMSRSYPPRTVRRRAIRIRLKMLGLFRAWRSACLIGGQPRRKARTYLHASTELFRTWPSRSWLLFHRRISPRSRCNSAEI